MEANGEILAQYDLMNIIVAIGLGTAARVAVLRSDARQMPSVPTGWFIYLVNGFIAAALGAVAIPALMAKDFVAVTFLALAVQHFREIRKQQEESLLLLETTEYTPRGKAYIDGIAKTFEARNYIALLTAFAAVLGVQVIQPQSTWLRAAVAVASGAAVACLLMLLTRGKRVGDVCAVYQAQFRLEGPALYVEDIYVTSLLGTEHHQAMFLQEGMAFIIKPNGPKHRLAIEHEGQRQAMLSDAVRSFGVKKLQFTRRCFDDGRVVIAFVPITPDAEGIAKVIRETPVLESIRKRKHIFRRL